MFQETVSDRLGTMRNIGVDDILGALGLERRRTLASNVLPIASSFAAGALMGAGLALLFAPKPGREMRQDIRQRAGEVGRRVSEVAEGAVTEVRNVLPHGHGEDRVARPTRSNEMVERRPEPTNAVHVPPLK